MDYNYPTCVEDLTNLYVSDVGCGKDYTAIIAS